MLVQSLSAGNMFTRYFAGSKPLLNFNLVYSRSVVNEFACVSTRARTTNGFAVSIRVRFSERSNPLAYEIKDPQYPAQLYRVCGRHKSRRRNHRLESTPVGISLDGENVSSTDVARWRNRAGGGVRRG